MAAGLFLELTAFCEAAHKRGLQVPEFEVGVVTPYRQQKACLRETFNRMAGPAAASKVVHFCGSSGFARCISRYSPMSEVFAPRYLAGLASTHG